MLVIAPFLEKAAQFSFKVNDSLSSDYLYNFLVVAEGPGFSTAKNITVEGASASTVMKFRIDDVSAEQEGSNIVIDAAIENYGSEPLTNAEITSSNSLFRDQMKYVSVLPGETKHVTFSYPIMLNASNYSFDISVASGDYRTSKTVPFVMQSSGSSGASYLNAFIAALIIIVSAANVIIYWPALNKRYFKGVKSKQKIQKQDSGRKYEKHLDKYKIIRSMDFLSDLDKQKKMDDERHTIDELKSRRHKR
jgi:hypothetical protein